jgi:putative nucleotidyltransferase with HDIG domain
MRHVTIVSDSEAAARLIAARLSGSFRTDAIDVHDLPAAPPGQYTLVDIGLRDPVHFQGLRRWLRRKPESGQVIFGVDRESHLQSVRAYAIGATGLLPRPIDGETLAQKLADRSGGAGEGSRAAAKDCASGISAGASALEDIFAAALSGETPDLRSVDVAGDTVIASIEEEGLARWLELVRRHHSQTYQHCLIVTAVAVSFGQLLGFSNADRRRLAAAGLLHDIGKARIPLEILEKPARLNEEELTVMRQHPLYGFEALKDAPGLQPEMLDMVVHHHEYLDGSGYPHGLQASELSDLVRTITIADIYGALLERRPYKAPMTGSEAYQVLKDMGPRLDADLVREFRGVTGLDR